jgi:hypothetical protein
MIENQDRAFEQPKPDFGERAGPDGNCEALAFRSLLRPQTKRLPSTHSICIGMRFTVGRSADLMVGGDPSSVKGLRGVRMRLRLLQCPIAYAG